MKWSMELLFTCKNRDWGSASGSGFPISSFIFKILYLHPSIPFSTQASHCLLVTFQGISLSFCGLQLTSRESSSTACAVYRLTTWAAAIPGTLIGDSSVSNVWFPWLSSWQVRNEVMDMISLSHYESRGRKKFPEFVLSFSLWKFFENQALISKNRETLKWRNLESNGSELS